MYEHIKPDANLVIGNYEPRHRGNYHNWRLHGDTACPFPSRNFAIQNWTTKPTRGSSRMQGRLLEPGPNQWGENESYSNRGGSENQNGESLD